MGRGGPGEWETPVQAIESLGVGGGQTTNLGWTKASEKLRLWGICLRNPRGCISKERASGPGPQFMLGSLFRGLYGSSRETFPWSIKAQ